jgi:ketosteroid isomerase-like protein
MAKTMNTTLDVGHQLVELCRQGKASDAINSLYDPKIVSIEAQGNEVIPARLEGLDAVRGKKEWWEQNHEVHSADVGGPWPHGDRFIVHFKFDVTAKAGPMAGQRMKLNEAALYTVKDGKIVQEEFFYDMS